MPHMRTSISGGRHGLDGLEVALGGHPCDVIRPLPRYVAVARLPSQEVSVCQVASVSGRLAVDGVGGGCFVPHMRTSISGGRHGLDGLEVALGWHPCDVIRPLSRIVAVARLPSQAVSVCQVASVSGW